MDSITQAALGAAIGQEVLGRKVGIKGAVIGAIVATIPDLDILFLPFFNDLQKLSIHRGFSHSILFSLIGAALVAFLLSKYRSTQKISFKRLLAFSWLALFTHMLLDAFTTYGTQLFSPFSDYRVSFDSINIVDPIYTLPLLIGLVITLYFQRKYQKRHVANLVGLTTQYYLLMFHSLSQSTY